MQEKIPRKAKSPKRAPSGSRRMAAKRKAGALLQHVLPKDNITPEPADLGDDDPYTGSSLMKDAEKLKMMLLAWNYNDHIQGRNGDVEMTPAASAGGATAGAAEGTAGSMAELWASYHSALGLARPAKPPDRTSPPHASAAAEVARDVDETSSSAGGAQGDDDALLPSDDDSDERADTQHHDPERLKAFNMFVRLFVDENLDRIVPISKQPKEKIQAIIDSCARQFPEFAERARKRIRTYLKSCRRNKKVRGDTPATSTGVSWDAAVRPTPAHLTSVQAEHILAQACENESLNAKRMRLGLDPVSQPMPTVPGACALDTTAASSQVANQFLNLYTGTASTQLVPTLTRDSRASPGPPSKTESAPGGSPGTTVSAENGVGLLNNNCIVKGQSEGGGNGGSKHASPVSSPAPSSLYRPAFPQTFGQPVPFSRQSASVPPAPPVCATGGAPAAALLALGGAGAVAAYQSALLGAMAAHPSLAGFGALATPALAPALAGLTANAPTDLSMKNVSTSTTSLAATSALLGNPLSINTTSSSSSHPLGITTFGSSPASTSTATGNSKPLILSHKLSTNEIAAVRQLITGYRESAAFLLRSADELESLLLQQP